MPMLDVQKRHAEVFRLRLGDKAPNGAPRKLLDAMRVTSPNRSVVDAFVAEFGGETKAWEQQWEAYLPVTALPVMVLPGQSISQWWESYKGAVCERRCDGFTETLSGRSCMCPSDITDRLAAAGACRPMTRINIVCPDVDVVGAGSLVTHGMVAAETLPQSIAIAEAALARGLMVPAVLRVVQHKGKNRQYIVPQLEIVGVSLNALTTGEAPARLEPVRPAEVAAPSQRALPAPAPVRSGGEPNSSAPVAAPPRAPAKKAAAAPRPPLPNEVRGAMLPPQPTAKAEPVGGDGFVSELEQRRDLLDAEHWTIAKRVFTEKRLPRIENMTEARYREALDVLLMVGGQQKETHDRRRKAANAALKAVGFTSDEDRHAAIGLATEGATESTAGLSEEQLAQVLAYCKQVEASQQPTLDEAS